MARSRVSGEEPARPTSPPAKTPEEREQQLIGAAVDLAEDQIRGGTASAQVITHYLKLGSSRERLEQERLKRENILLGAKAEAMESAKRMEELYVEAIAAMRSYAGGGPMQVVSEMIDDADDY